MKSNNAKALLNQIDIAIKDINGFISASPLEKTYLAKFLTVFICGIYEESIEIIVREMAQKNSHPNVSNYVTSTMDSYFRNPNIENICKCLNRFDPHWSDQIKKLSQQSKRALDSIIVNKNAVAHGQQITLLLSDIIAYYNDSKIVIEKIDSILL